MLSDTAGPALAGRGRSTSRSAPPACTCSTTCAAGGRRRPRAERVTSPRVADEIAAAADLVKGKTAGVPVALVRGLAPTATPSEDTPGARALVRTGPNDWFGSGWVEAVRAALGVEAGTELAAEVGIPSALPEPPATRVERARRVALLGVEGVSASTGPEGVVLQGEDAFTLGLAASRLVVALHGEGLAGRVERLPATGRQLQARVKTT